MIFRYLEKAIVCLRNIASQCIQQQRTVHIQKRRNKFIVQLKNELLRLNEEKNERNSENDRKSEKNGLKSQ